MGQKYLATGHGRRPQDGKEHPLGKNDGMRIFDGYFSGQEPYRHRLFRPEPGANLDQVKLMYEESGAFIFGRRTYDIANGWGGAHPVNGVPVFVLTHTPPPADTVPKGPSNLTFVFDGIASAIQQARQVAGGKDIKLGGASPGQQALKAGLCDEILIHLAPYVLGDGVRLLERLGGPIRLEKLSVSDGPLATHLRYRVSPGEAAGAFRHWPGHWIPRDATGRRRCKGSSLLIGAMPRTSVKGVGTMLCCWTAAR